MKIVLAGGSGQVGRVLACAFSAERHAVVVLSRAPHRAPAGAAPRFLAAHEELDGAVNLAAPNPLPNAEFMAALRRAWGTRIALPAREWMLEVGAFLLRTETELVLKSRRVVPGRLLQAGFSFAFPDWPAAAAELCARSRS